MNFSITVNITISAAVSGAIIVGFGRWLGWW